MNVALLFRSARSLAAQALLVLALAALLAACGASAKAQTAKGGSGASGVGAAGEPIDACALVTKAEAAALLGVPVGEPQPDTVPGGVTTCTYLPSTPRDMKSVFVWANPRKTADGARTVFDNTMEKGAPGVDVAVRDQAGLGDGAFWADNQLWVLKGKVVVGVWADSEANTLKLAGQVLKRLP